MEVDRAVAKILRMEWSRDCYWLSKCSLTGSHG